ncbi:hypothetical protein MMC08_007964, partial [Hypocenomyce scalaris]|nr:hypothetical protein [Hypocenomyce scalaris]
MTVDHIPQFNATAEVFEDEVEKYSPATNGTALECVGLSDIRSYMGSDGLKHVLSGYNWAVVQT